MKSACAPVAPVLPDLDPPAPQGPVALATLRLVALATLRLVAVRPRAGGTGGPGIAFGRD